MVLFGQVLAVLLILDLIAGAAAAIYQRRYDGNLLFMRTVAKMTGYACSVLAIYLVIWTGAEVTSLTQDLKRDGVAAAMLTILSLFVLHEGRSVLLNSAKMDLPIIGYVGRWLRKKEMKAKASLLDGE